MAIAKVLIRFIGHPPKVEYDCRDPQVLAVILDAKEASEIEVSLGLCIGWARIRAALD
jgi:hypothetical protein